ncbi:hypothetical protein T492DRAFT_1023023 [Pavlovales sp. CCMP2436]|nr:hypothetical protein T492DRAFT_1023023 [Pavlovales sp. CCMP2436]
MVRGRSCRNRAYGFVSPCDSRCIFGKTLLAAPRSVSQGSVSSPLEFRRFLSRALAFARRSHSCLRGMDTRVGNPCSLPASLLKPKYVAGPSQLVHARAPFLPMAPRTCRKTDTPQPLWISRHEVSHDPVGGGTANTTAMGKAAPSEATQVNRIAE